MSLPLAIQVEQIRSMRTEGAEFSDIQRHFKKSYRIYLSLKTISDVCKGIKKTRAWRERRKILYGRRRGDTLSGALYTGECSRKPFCKYGDVCELSVCRFVQIVEE